MGSFIYKRCKDPMYRVLWVSKERQFISSGFDNFDHAILLIEKWYQTKPRHKLKPKIVCNTTGRVVYD